MDAELREIEAIKRLKYRYMRCLDLKRWDEMRECFTEDARAAYSGGRYRFEGRDLITAHHVHHPEIELISATTARGTWALEDTVIHLGHDITLRGAAFYQDEYEKRDGHWRIRSTGYERLYEEVQPRKDTPGLRLTANRWSEP
jgi:hypothetical protein